MDVTATRREGGFSRMEDDGVENVLANALSHATYFINVFLCCHILFYYADWKLRATWQKHPRKHQFLNFMKSDFCAKTILTTHKKYFMKETQRSEEIQRSIFFYYFISRDTVCMNMFCSFVGIISFGNLKPFKYVAHTIHTNSICKYHREIYHSF